MSFAPPKDDCLDVAVSQQLPDDLSTIDVEALANLSAEVPASPVPPLLPVTPVRYAVNTSGPVSTPVSEEVIRSCVTPRKVAGIQKALQKETERHKCALKLLPFFFTKEELTKSNTDGSHGKERLDGNKLNSLKVLVFSKYPVDCPMDKEKLWKSIKGKINSKCRASKFANVVKED